MIGSDRLKRAGCDKDGLYIQAWTANTKYNGHFGKTSMEKKGVIFNCEQIRVAHCEIIQDFGFAISGCFSMTKLNL